MNNSYFVKAVKRLQYEYHLTFNQVIQEFGIEYINDFASSLYGDHYKRVMYYNAGKRFKRYNKVRHKQKDQFLDKRRSLNFRDKQIYDNGRKNRHND